MSLGILNILFDKGDGDGPTCLFLVDKGNIVYQSVQVSAFTHVETYLAHSNLKSVDFVNLLLPFGLVFMV